MNAPAPARTEDYFAAYAAILRLYLQLDDSARRQLDASLARREDRVFAAGWPRWRDAMLQAPIWTERAAA